MAPLPVEPGLIDGDVDHEIGIDGGDAVVDRLNAYAAELLEPDPATVGRMRAAVMLEARRAAAINAGAVPRPVEEPSRAFGWRAALAALLSRRPALTLVGSLLIIVVMANAALAASGPGGPLYPVRLWTEAVSLPADPADRLNTELVRLHTRLHEAATASAEGNGAGVTASLDAYRATMEGAWAAADIDPGRRAAVATELARDRATLIAVANRVPNGADPAIAAALRRTEAGIDALLSGDAASPSGSPDSPGAGGSPRQPERPSQGQPPGPPSSRPGVQPPSSAPPATSQAPTLGPSPRPSVSSTPKPQPTPRASQHGPKASPGH